VVFVVEYYILYTEYFFVNPSVHKFNHKIGQENIKMSHKLYQCAYVLDLSSYHHVSMLFTHQALPPPFTMSPLTPPPSYPVTLPDLPLMHFNLSLSPFPKLAGCLLQCLLSHRPTIIQCMMTQFDLKKMELDDYGPTLTQIR
jgi:hypothetical protein